MKESDTSTGVQQRRRVNEHAKKMVAQKFRDSSLPDHFAHLPKFTLNDIVMGKFLGHGNFGRVMEVISLDRMHSLSPSRKNTESTRGSSTRSNFASFGGASSMKKNRWFQRTNTKTGRLESEEDEDNYCYCDEEDDDEEESLNDLSAALPAEDVLNKKQETARKFMQEHCLREHPNGKPSARYAIKILKDDVLQDPNKLYFQGIMDMAGETRLLSNLQHPNIIKLRGVGNNPCTEKYFLILDRLYEVLEDRWKVWQKKKQRFTSVLGILDRKGLKRAALWEERVIAAHDLASGLSYLHSKKIIHRDIKSDNIGFDVRGDIKIFDFGLARELPPQAKASNDGTWKMTGSTGTPRYMSPEVALEKPYNESCDTYSFCILLWEILALNTAFELYTWASFRSRVWQAPYKRPYINPVSCAWPKEVQSLLQQGWDNDLTCRQPMSEIVETLRKEAIRSSDALDEQWGLEIERRSTHVFDEGDLQHLHGSHKSLLSLIASPLRTSNRFREPKVEYGGIRSPLFNPNKKKTKELAATLDSTAATSIMSESQYNSRSSGHLSPRLSNILQLQPPLEDNGEEQVEIQQPKQMKQRPALVSTPSEIFRHVKAETVRRQRNRIMDVQDEEDDEVLISPKSTPSKIYKEVKDESVRRQRRRIFVDSSDSKDDEDDMGYNNMSPAAPRLSESQENKNSSPPSVKTTARPSPIWNRIREENLRQKQIRMRLKSSRDNAVVPSQ